MANRHRWQRLVAVRSRLGEPQDERGIDLVAEGVLEVFRRREELRGYRITEAPKVLRHFSARFAPL